MPIVVDPGFAWPPEVDPVVSPDGKITAIVDPAHAGVLLRADFDDSVPDTPAVPEKVLRRNLAKNPNFTTLLRPMGSAENASTGGGASLTVDGTWSSHGSTSWKVTPAGSTSSSVYVRNNQANSPDGDWSGKTVTVSATIRVDREQTGPVDNLAREIVIGTRTGENGSVTDWAAARSGAAPNKAGVTRLSATLTLPKTGMTNWFIRLMNGSTDVTVWWDGLTIEEGETDGSYFDGSSTQSGNNRYRWTGAENVSASEEFTPATPFIPGHDATTAKVRFERQDGTVVRSGNPAWAPGGYAHAYDHEATLGGGTLWRAVPIRFDGTEGEPSEYVGAVIPALTDGWAWLKPVTDPDKAMLLKVEPPDLSYDGRVDTTSIAGAPRPAATWDVLEGFTTQLRSLVREKDVEEQLMALLDEGPVLAQFPACAGLPDFYFIRGKLDLEHVHWDGWPWRRYQWDVIQIDCPDTTDSPLRIPGLSYDTVARDWTTYDQLAATVESYNKLLEP